MNKKGFTLIELIVVIAIMGVILILALPQISSIQSANRDRKYEAYKESFTSASKLYVDNHARDMFGYNDSGCAIIKYSDLKGSNLIKDFASIDVTCSRDTDTFVEVRKVGNNYKYAGSLVCRSKDGQIVKSIKDDLEGSSCINEPDENGPIITSNPSSHNWVQTKNLKVNIIVSDVSGLNRNIGIQYHWVNLDNGSTSQTYTYSYNNKKDVDKVSFRIPTKNIPTVTGNYRLIIEPWKTPNTNGVQDVLGNITYSGVSKEIYRIDNTNPTCGTVTGSKTYWTNQNFTISQACNDSHSGCVKNIYDQYFSSTTKTFTFTISDNAGNTTTCGVNVYLDKDYPTCGTVTGASTSWTASNRNITVQCNDKSTGSGCTQPSFQKTFSSTTKVGKISISDIAGNVTQCNVNAYVDKTAPTCGTVTGASTSWTNQNRTITVKCNDNDSGCGSFSKTYSTTTKTSSMEIRDNVGNKRTCSYNVYVDKTPPSISFGIDGIRTGVYTCSDGDSGISGSTRVSVGLTGSSNYTLSRSCKDNAGNVTNGSHTYRYSSCARGENTCAYGCDSCYNSCLTGSPSVCQGGYVNGSAYSCCKSSITQYLWRYINRYDTGTCWGGPTICCAADTGGTFKCYRTGGTREKCTVWGTCYNRVWSNCAYTINTCRGGYYNCNCSSCHTGHNTCEAGWWF